jgi:uncharacterized protein with ATP-grasp and redox domains
MTSDPGSFARATIVERKPQIIQRVIDDNAYPPDLVAGLKAFQDEIAGRPMQPLIEAAPDVEFWNTQLASYSGKTWLEIPWYFAETYFYRRLLEATRYFQSGPWQGRNPFQKQKQILMEADTQRLAGTWDQLSGLEPNILFEGLLHSCLWGNRADLSNYTVKVKARSGLATRQERHLILIDHTDQARTLLAKGVQRLDFINDNVGSELIFDLALADFLLQQGWARHVCLHLKNQPFFVSDAMPADVEQTIALLKRAPSAAMRDMGVRLEAALSVRQVHLDADPFWTTCLMFRQMPQHLREQVAQANLVLIKGDVNYRRLLDDLHWPFTTRMDALTGYFPAPFCVLRTLKGEILVGLAPGQAEALEAEDPTWLINGKRGLIQLVTTDQQARP